MQQTLPIPTPPDTSPDYTAQDITVLEGLEAVRVRPGMYIGSTGLSGLQHLMIEILDNAVDEAMAGYCTRVELKIDADGLITISDNGRGIPVDVHPTTGKSALETVMTTLHAGGKFGSGAYKVTGGLHGVGASVVNGLSEYLRAEVRRDSVLYSQEYSRGLPTTALVKEGKTGEHGTTVCFRPDPEIFDEIEYDFDELIRHFKDIAYLNKGLEICFTAIGTTSGAMGILSAPISSMAASPTWCATITATGGCCSPCPSTTRRPWTIPLWKWRCNTMTGTRNRCIPMPTASRLPMAEHT